MKIYQDKLSSDQSLVDIRNVHVDKLMPREKRITDFIQQIKNSFLFKCGPFTVHVGFPASFAS